MPLQTDKPTATKRKLLFIVNPNAGKRKSGWIIELVKKGLPAGLDYEIVQTRDKSHFESLTQNIISAGYTDVIAVGGDGTVNHVAASLLNSGITLGIIPIGSGNGLARTLGISVIIPETIKQIAEGRHTFIDAGKVNGTSFFCTSGVGFDARIGDLFATAPQRGLKTYVKIILREIFSYRAREYEIELDDRVIKKKAFLITVANAGQYGNDFYIAPLASLQDGLFHVVIMKPFGLFSAAGIFLNILRRKAHLSRYIETYTTSSLTINRSDEDTIHYDGEPMKAGRHLKFENTRQVLKVMVGEKFKAG